MKLDTGAESVGDSERQPLALGGRRRIAVHARCAALPYLPASSDAQGRCRRVGHNTPRRISAAAA